MILTLIFQAFFGNIAYVGFGGIQEGHALYYQNDELGIYKEDFYFNDAGFVIESTDAECPPSLSVDFDMTQGQVSLDNGSGGDHFCVSDIEVSSATGRNNIHIQGSDTQDGGIEVELLDCTSGTSLLGPVATDALGNVSIEGLSSDISCVRPKIIFQDTSAIVTSFELDWTPLPVFLIDLDGPQSLLAGECATYDLRWSLSYTDESDVVTYVSLPEIDGSGINVQTPNSSYQQYPDANLTLDTITNAGIYTDTDVTVQGRTIPANSIYREIGTEVLGSTRKYQYVLCSSNLSEDGLSRDMTAEIYGSLATSKSDTVQTELVSAPNPRLNTGSPSFAYMAGGTGRIGGTFDTYHLGIGGNQAGIVDYQIKLENPVTAFGAEDIFLPVVTLDFADTYAGMQASTCTTDEADFQSKVTLPEGWVWMSSTSTTARYDPDGIGAGAYPAHSSYPTWSDMTGVEDLGVYQESFTVDFAGCTDIADTYDVTLSRDGDNSQVPEFPLEYLYQAEIVSSYCGDNIVQNPNRLGEEEICDGTDIGACQTGEICSAVCDCITPGSASATSSSGGGGGGGGGRHDKCVTTDYDRSGEPDEPNFGDQDNTVCWSAITRDPAGAYTGLGYTGPWPYNSASFFFDETTFTLSVDNDQGARRGLFMNDTFADDSGGVFQVTDIRVEAVTPNGYVSTNPAKSMSYVNDEYGGVGRDDINRQARTDSDDRVGIYYNTLPTPATPTTGDLTGLGGAANIPTTMGSGWTLTQPADLSSVQTIGAYIPCLNGVAGGAAGSSCEGGPTQVHVKYQVSRSHDQALCDAEAPFYAENDMDLHQLYLSSATQDDTHTPNVGSGFISEDGVVVQVLAPTLGPVFPEFDPLSNIIVGTSGATNQGLIGIDFQQYDSMQSPFKKDTNGVSLDVTGDILIDMPDSCGSRVDSIDVVMSTSGTQQNTIDATASACTELLGTTNGLIEERKTIGYLPAGASEVSCEYSYDTAITTWLVYCDYILEGEQYTDEHINFAPSTKGRQNYANARIDENDFDITIDQVGATQKVLVDSEGNIIASIGVVINGVHYLVVMRYDGQDWEQIGDIGVGDDITTIGRQFGGRIALDGADNVYISYYHYDQSPRVSLVKKRNGTDWELMGQEGFGDGTSTQYVTDIVADRNGDLFLVYQDYASAGGRTTVRTWDGTNRVTLGGPGIGEGTARHYGHSLNVDENNMLYVTYADESNGARPSVMKRNGSSRDHIGNPGMDEVDENSSARLQVKFDPDGSPVVLYGTRDGSSYTPKVRKRNGSSREFVGNPGLDPIEDYRHLNLYIDTVGDYYVGVRDFGHDRQMGVRKWNGTMREQVGDYDQITIGNGARPLLFQTEDGTLSVMFLDRTVDRFIDIKGYLPIPQGIYLESSILDYSYDTLTEYVSCLMQEGAMSAPDATDLGWSSVTMFDDQGMSSTSVSYNQLLGSQPVPSATLNPNGDIVIPYASDARNENEVIKYSIAYTYPDQACLTDDMTVAGSISASSRGNDATGGSCDALEGVPGAPLFTGQLVQGVPGVSYEAPVALPYVTPSEMITEKFHDALLIPATGSINYLMEVQTYGQTDDNTVVYDQVPLGTEFARAYITGAFASSAFIGYTGGDMTYQCDGCEVWFSTGSPLLGTFPFSPLTPLDTDPAAEGFTQGSGNGDGTRSSPFGTGTRWIAYKINQLDPGRSIAFDPWIQTFGYSVVNATNLPGDLIYNEVATVSETLLQSVSNYVQTALISEQTYDLGLTLTLGEGQTLGAMPGDVVVFDAHVQNQGSYLAEDIGVTVSLSTGLILTDTNWTDNQDGTATYSGSISVAPGDIITVPVTFQVDPTFIETQIVVWAEISSDNSDVYNVSDIDSLPDMDLTNDYYTGAYAPDTNVYPGSADNMYTGTNDMSGGLSGDEDDHDPAYLMINPNFDLALTKTVLTTGDVAPGDAVTFNVMITNQGDIPALLVEVTDYLSSDFIFLDTDQENIDNGWMKDGNTLTSTGIDTINPGESKSLTLTVQIDPEFTGDELTNYAEISAIDNDDDRSNGFLADIDSIPDANDTNDIGGTPMSAEDDHIDDDGIDTDGDGIADEDDHDPATVYIGQPVAIYGTIYFDDEDDDMYTGDDGLADMTVQLLDETGTVIATTMTDESGAYAFEGLPEGTYGVQYINTSEYTPDSSIGGMVDTTTGAGPYSIETSIMIFSGIQLDAGEKSINNDFGLIEILPVSIYGTIYFDDEDDDMYEGDMGLVNISVQLLDRSGEIIDTTTTNELGTYAFEELPAGTYAVQYINSSMYASDSSRGGMVDTSTGTGPDSTETSIMILSGIELDPGEESINNDFGLIDVTPVGIYGTIYFDDEDDDMYEGDGGIANMIVELLDEDGETIATTTTDETGAYGFEGLSAGTYAVQYINSSMYASDSSIGGMVDTSTGTGPDSTETSVMILSGIELDPGEESINNDFGLIDVTPVAIYGTIYFDDEDDDMYEGDGGIENMRVELLDEDGETIATTTTDETGAYGFEGLSAGTYAIQYINSSTHTSDSSIGGMVDTSTGTGPNSTETSIMILSGIELDPGEESISNDFGLIMVFASSRTGGGGGSPYIEKIPDEPVEAGSGELEKDIIEEVIEQETPVQEDVISFSSAPEKPVAIYGAIYFDDEDNDNYIDDEGIEGIMVSLENADGNVEQTIRTSKDGSFEFVGLDAGEYCVHYINNTEYMSDSSDGGIIDPVTGEGPESIEIGKDRHCGIVLDPGEESIMNNFGLIKVFEEITYHNAPLVLDENLPVLLPATGAGA